MKPDSIRIYHYRIKTIKKIPNLLHILLQKNCFNKLIITLY